MTTYMVTAQVNPTSFSVGVIGGDGARQTMVGFVSRIAAEDWIASDKLCDTSLHGLRTRLGY
jgi:hypothetical protein